MNLFAWLRNSSNRPLKWALLLLTSLLGLYLLYQLLPVLAYLRNRDDPRNIAVWQWAQGDQTSREALITRQSDSCADALFMLPGEGFIGLLYADPRAPYSSRNPHQGIDIFSQAAAGQTPVYAAYDGYLTREEGWRSSLIIRVPDDPLRPGQPVWMYYTHMADRDGNDFIDDAFPPGTREKFVERGSLLGYMGDYNGDSPRTVWVHLHFSLVKDDGHGRYLNELDFDNSLDPSPYFNLPLNYQTTTAVPPTCAP